jgi:hypothetical protein
VTVRITVVQDGATARLTLAGQLVGEDSAELLRVCETLPAPQTLELGGLQFVDREAARVLRDLQARGVVLVGASPYIRLVLGQPATEE